MSTVPKAPPSPPGGYRPPTRRVPEIDDIGGLAFWLKPIWSPDGRDNLRDPGTEPFWMRRRVARPDPHKRIGTVAPDGRVLIGIYSNSEGEYREHWMRPDQARDPWAANKEQAMRSVER